MEEEVARALEMLEPRFSRQKGKRRSREDKLSQYRPFAYLEREQQRSIIRSGHPKELSVAQHLSGLCAMAMESCNEQSETYGIISHIHQLLDDGSYLQWPSVRAFSNTVIAQIACGRWSWCDDRMIERCRTNLYLRCRPGEDSSWSVPCPRFNKGRCNEQDTHAVGEVIMHHVYVFCAMNVYENPHTVRACKWKKGASGNAHQRRTSHEDKRDSRHHRFPGRNRHETTHESAKN